MATTILEGVDEDRGLGAPWEDPYKDLDIEELEDMLASQLFEIYIRIFFFF
jgi:hypothetical protein